MDLVIVGHCPSCGCPIYGKQCLRSDEAPVSKKSCVCAPLMLLPPLSPAQPPAQPSPYSPPINPWAPVVNPWTTGGDTKYEGPQINVHW